MAYPLSRTTLITRVFAAAPLGTLFAAGSSAVDGLATASVDTSNYEGALFIQSLIHGGTSAASGITFAVRQSTAVIVDRSSGGQGTALTGASATLPTGSSATPEAVVVDVYKPRRNGTANFLFGQWTIPSSCAMVASGYCIQYGARQFGNSTNANTIPQTTASANGITGGVTLAVSPST
jgi:hypothetical protein